MTTSTVIGIDIDVPSWFLLSLLKNYVSTSDKKKSKMKAFTM